MNEKKPNILSALLIVLTILIFLLVLILATTSIGLWLLVTLINLSV